MWAARPHLASIFEKLLDQKTFSCLWLVPCNQYRKTFFDFSTKKDCCQNKFLLTVFAAYVIMQVQPTDILERMKVHEK